MNLTAISDAMRQHAWQPLPTGVPVPPPPRKRSHTPPHPMPSPAAPRRLACHGCGAPQQRGEKACSYCRLPA